MYVLSNYVFFTKVKRAALCIGLVCEIRCYINFSNKLFLKLTCMKIRDTCLAALPKSRANFKWKSLPVFACPYGCISYFLNLYTWYYFANWFIAAEAVWKFSNLSVAIFMWQNLLGIWARGRLSIWARICWKIFSALHGCNNKWFIEWICILTQWIKGNKMHIYIFKRLQKYFYVFIC